MDTANVHYILHRQQTENAYIAASNTSIYIQFQNKVLVLKVGVFWQLKCKSSFKLKMSGVICTWKKVPDLITMIK